eukprot:GILJ01002539.1.p1 GENE.GILJ01002539.1~~GILJ01002539.1.p1  ORF type:complete len:820 (-),score=187.19 GILJ01002539.1:123-2531(-)
MDIETKGKGKGKAKAQSKAEQFRAAMEELDLQRQHIDILEKEQIDLEIIKTLTDADLQELGLPLDVRRKIALFISGGSKKEEKKSTKRRGRADDDDDAPQDEDTKRVAKILKQSVEGHAVEDYITISTSPSGEPVINFKHKSSQLRNLVQMMTARYYYRKGKIEYIPFATFSDLFLARKNLEIVLRDDLETEQDGDDDSEEDSDFEQAVKEQMLTLKRLYLNVTNQKVPLGLAELVDWLNTHPLTTAKLKEVERLQAKGQISFESLGEVFSPGVFIIGQSQDTGYSFVGYRVISGGYQWRGNYHSKSEALEPNPSAVSFQLAMHYIISTGSQYLVLTHTDVLSRFHNNISPSLLRYQVMTPETKQRLTERGRRFIKFAVGSHYLAYTSDSFFIHAPRVKQTTKQNDPYQVVQQTQAHNSYVTALRGRGRVMLDTQIAAKLNHFAGESSLQAFQMSQFFVMQQQQKLQEQQQMMTQSFQHRSHPNMYGGFNHQNRLGTSITLDTVHESKLSICWPAVAGFSFSAKAWGHALIDGLSDIQFDDNAFQQLVLAPERKDLIRAMVSQTNLHARDIISGKGCGTIFLLHGPPGTGKTLTAEAISEMLHRPMYVVSVAELGTTPRELEENICQVFELATVWKALVLMDEADIFLEKRSQHEIVRNAMVGVLLRQTEMFQGVLFLTSNRVAVFDEAFQSRITVGLKYEPLTKRSRAEVWKILLNTSAITTIPDSAVELLSAPALNGREIKNCIALAEGLAKNEGQDVTIEHLKRTVHVSMDFKVEMDSTRDRTSANSALALAMQLQDSI